MTYKRKYEVGNTLIFKGESNKFTFGSEYIIFQIDKEYKNRDEYCLYFKGTHYGCFAKFADYNFETIDEIRDSKLKNILG